MSYLIYFIITVFVHSISSTCLNDKYRPQIHFSPAKHWLNDPNGLIYLDGEYHLFYQYNPNGTNVGPIHWGHAISSDLLHWKELPIAIYPDSLGLIFSGSAVLDTRNTSGLQTGDNPPIVAFYTQAGRVQLQSIAVSNDKGRTFQKYVGNPILLSPNSPDFRDPKVFEYNGQWIMSLAVGNRISFYSSENLKNWSPLSDFGAKPLQGSHGGVWECPDLLPFNINNRKLWVLLVSINPGGPNPGSATQYFLGDFNGKDFRKIGFNKTLWWDWGPDNYAGVTFSNEPKNRKLLIAWMNNWSYGNLVPTLEWRGQMTLPRVLELKNIDGKVRLASTPAEEVELLRNSSQFYASIEQMTIRSGSIYNLTNDLTFINPLLEIDVAFDTKLTTLDPSARFEICFFNSLNEELYFGYNYRNNSFYLDRSKSGDAAFHPDFVRRATAMRETRNKIIDFKIFLDTSAIEVLADGGLTGMTALFYPTEPLTGIKIAFTSTNRNNVLTVRSVSVRGLKSIYDC